MRIAVFNTYQRTGGAARAAQRLVNGLREQMHEVHYLFKVAEELSCEYDVELNDLKYHSLIVEKLIQNYYITKNRTPLSNTLFSFTSSGANLHNESLLSSANIINLHWIEKFLSLNSLNDIILAGKPIVWTLHDERPFTGGCHYTSGCIGYTEDCVSCPQLRLDPHGLPKRMLELKRDLLENVPMVVVTPSKWLGIAAQTSTIFSNKRVEVIPNGVPVETYKPMNKAVCKEKIGVPENSIVLQFAAQDGRELRKGFRYLKEAISHCMDDPIFRNMCSEKRIVLLTLGEKSKEIIDFPLVIQSLGYVEDEGMIAESYNATDIYILPSMEDNLPNTLLESMACGTPVVAFDVGGIPDVVKNYLNGVLVRKGDSRGLASAIVRLVRDEVLRKEIGKNAHNEILSRYTLRHQAKAYSLLFEDVQDLGKTQSEKNKEKNFVSCYDDLLGFSLRRGVTYDSLKVLSPEENGEKNIRSSYKKIKKKLEVITSKIF